MRYLLQIVHALGTHSTLHIDQPTLEAKVPTEPRECVDGALHGLLAGEHLVQPAFAILAFDYVGAQHGHAVSMGGIYPAAGRNGNILVTEVAEVIDAGPVHESIVIVLLRAVEVTAERGILTESTLSLSLFLSLTDRPDSCPSYRGRWAARVWHLFVDVRSQSPSACPDRPPRHARPCPGHMQSGPNRRPYCAPGMSTAAHCSSLAPPRAELQFGQLEHVDNDVAVVVVAGRALLKLQLLQLLLLLAKWLERCLSSWHLSGRRGNSFYRLQGDRFRRKHLKATTWMISNASVCLSAVLPLAFDNRISNTICNRVKWGLIRVNRFGALTYRMLRSISHKLVPSFASMFILCCILCSAYLNCTTSKYKS